MAHQVTLLSFVNAYLVEEEDDLTLVDTGLASGAGKILAAAEELGKPIHRIAITHGHPDHVGGIDKLATQLPGVEVLIPARDAKIMRGDKSPEPGEPKGTLLPGWAEPKAAYTTIAPGDTVGSLEVHAAPGHSPGQVAFLDPRDGTLFCGDAYDNLMGVRTTSKVQWPLPIPAAFTWHKPTALQTAIDLRALDPKALAPGHGKVVPDPGAKMDAAIRKVS